MKFFIPFVKFMQTSSVEMEPELATLIDLLCTFPINFGILCINTALLALYLAIVTLLLVGAMKLTQRVRSECRLYKFCRTLRKYDETTKWVIDGNNVLTVTVSDGLSTVTLFQEKLEYDVLDFLQVRSNIHQFNRRNQYSLIIKGQEDLFA